MPIHLMLFDYLAVTPLSFQSSPVAWKTLSLSYSAALQFTSTQKLTHTLQTTFPENQAGTICCLNCIDLNMHYQILIAWFNILERNWPEIFFFHNCTCWEQIRLGKGFCKFREDEIFKVFLLTSRFFSERKEFWKKEIFVTSRIGPQCSIDSTL